MVSACSVSSVLDAPSFKETSWIVDPRDKVTELQGTFKYEDKRVRIIRDLTEIHEVTWIDSSNKAVTVYVKYLRYATIAGSIQLNNNDKLRELKSVQNQIERLAELGRHPNIMPFMGYQLHDEPALVFSWYKNGNISQYSKAHPDADHFKLLQDTGRGLSFLHCLQPDPIIHGGIKPTNVIIGDLGQAMLVDFGMAPYLRAAERQITLLDPDWTPFLYMSPESIEEGAITTEADVYAFGVLALEILSGRPPYYKLNNIAAMMQITEGSTPSPEDHPRILYPSAVWDTLLQCWEIDPKKRPCIEEVCTSITRWSLEGPHS